PRRHQEGLRPVPPRGRGGGGTGAGDRVRRRRQSRSFGGRHPRRARHRRARRLDLPFRRIRRARGQGIHGQGGPPGPSRPVIRASPIGAPRMAEFDLAELAATIAERARAGGERSYTRKLLDQGIEKCAKKLGEEATETVVAALSSDKRALIGESADLLYHLLV